MKKENRPKIEIKKEPFDKKMEWLAISALIATFVVPAIYYNSLPDTIPIHFNSKGEADGFGPKYYVWILPLISLCLFGALSYVTKIPHKFNYLQEVTMDNAEKQYRGGVKMMVVLNAWCCCLLCFLTYSVVQNALGNQDGLGTYFTPLVLIGSIGIPTIYAIKSMSNNK